MEVISISLPEFESRDLTIPEPGRNHKPIAAFEGHTSYDFNPRLWSSLDGNYQFGATTSPDGVENSLTQTV